MGCSISLIRKKVKQELRTKHQEIRTESDDCRQSKLFLWGPDPLRAEWLLSLRRKDLKLLVEVVTGHCSLNYHSKKIKLSTTPTCQSCYEEDETAEHFLCECPSYLNARLRAFGSEFLHADNLIDISLKSVLNYIKSTGRLTIADENS